MGIFDDFNALQDDDTSQGGLIARLMQQAGVQSQYSPSAGFPSSPMDANASVPAPAASPIGVGNYQMPRIGPAAAFALPPGQIDPDTGDHVQPAAPAQQPATPSNPLMTAARALHSVAQGGSLFGAITGELDDPASLKSRQDQQQYQALVAGGVSPKVALVLVKSPEAGKALLADSLKDEKYAFTTLPDGTVVRQNARTGEVAPAYQGSAKPTFGIVGEDDGKKVYGWQDPSRRSVQPYQVPGSTGQSNTVTGPNGQPIAIPPGADRKTFVNEVTKSSADAATGKMTEVQAKASAYATRMEQSEAALRGLEGEGTSYTGRALDAVPFIGGSAATNSLQSSAYQKYKQASGNFITALLRQESGAAISKDEFSRYEKEMMPQAGDGQAVIAQKRAARAAAIDQMKRAAGPGYKSTTGNTASAPDPLGIR